MKGFLDKASTDRITGWVSRGPKDQRSLRVVLNVNGDDIAEVAADLARPAVAKNGHHATGFCGFEFSAETIPLSHRTARCEVRVFALPRKDQRVELHGSPKTMIWPNSQVSAVSKLFVLETSRVQQDQLTPTLQPSYDSERCLTQLESKYRAVSGKLGQHYDFVSGRLEVPTIKRLGLASFARVAMFYNPEQYLLRHLHWLQQLGRASLDGAAVSGTQRLIALARRAAHVDLTSSAELQQLLNWDDQAVRRQFDNRQTRFLLPAATSTVTETDVQKAQDQLSWFDLVGHEDHLPQFYRDLQELTLITAARNGSENVQPLANDFAEEVLGPFVQFDRQLCDFIKERIAKESAEFRLPSRTLLKAAPKSEHRFSATNGACDPTRRPSVVLKAPVPDNAKTLVVLGVSRGGTSLIAGLLRLSGVFMGHKVAHDSHEDAEFHTHDVAKLGQLIATRNQEQDTWGWKYPHSVEYLDEVIGQLRNPHFLVVFRDLVGVAQGFHRKHDIPMREAIVEAQHRYAKVVGFVSRCDYPLLSISYEKAVAQKEELVADLSAFCGLALTEKQKTTCYDFISPGNYVSLSAKKLRSARL